MVLHDYFTGNITDSRALWFLLFSVVWMRFQGIFLVTKLVPHHKLISSINSSHPMQKNISKETHSEFICKVQLKTAGVWWSAHALLIVEWKSLGRDRENPRVSSSLFKCLHSRDNENKSSNSSCHTIQLLGITRLAERDHPQCQL